MTFLDWSESQELWQLTTVLNQSLFFITKCCKKVSTIYTDIDYIYSYNASAEKKQLQTIKQLSSLCICRIPPKKAGGFSHDQNVGHSNVVARTSPSTVACVEQCGKPGESNGENQWERHRESHRFRSCPLKKWPFWLLLRLGELKIRWGDLNMF